MATNIAQSDMDTLFTQLQASSTGPYNIIGTDVGEFNAGMLTSSFEQNTALLLGMVEFMMKNIADPTSSTANALKARYQKKLLKEVLNHASANMKTIANSSSDDRATYTNTMIARLITYFNKNTTSETL